MATESELDGLAAAHGLWGNLLSKEQLHSLGISPSPDRETQRHKPNGRKEKPTQSKKNQDMVQVPKQVWNTWLVWC